MQAALEVRNLSLNVVTMVSSSGNLISLDPPREPEELAGAVLMDGDSSFDRVRPLGVSFWPTENLWPSGVGWVV